MQFMLKGMNDFFRIMRYDEHGHAAHPNNDNPIIKTMDVIQWFQNLSFDKVSDTLGPVKLTITQINAGSQHNVVPAQVNLVLDVRVNERYTNQEIADLVGQAPCEVTARSLRLQSSSIDNNHPLVVAGIAMGRNTYGSPTPVSYTHLRAHET